MTELLRLLPVLRIAAQTVRPKIDSDAIIAWAKTQETAEAFWEKCSRPELLMALLLFRGTILQGQSNDHAYYCIAVECAERCMPIFAARYPSDLRPMRAIQTAREKIARGGKDTSLDSCLAGSTLLHAAAIKFINDAAAADCCRAAAAANHAFAFEAASDAIRYSLSAVELSASHLLPEERMVQSDIVRKYFPNLPGKY